MTTLNVINFGKSFGAVPALRNVSFSLDAGETLAIIGRSGSGKTTLLRCIAGLQPVDQGSAELEGSRYLADGRLTVDGTSLRSNIVSVLQGGHLFPSMNCLDNLVFPLTRARRLPRSRAEEKAIDMAKRLGVSETLDRFPDEVSGGQAQRIALGRALLLRPKVLLLDEVTSSLDPATTLDVVQALRFIKGVSHAEKMGIIMTTHLLRFAFEFADRVGFLEKGELIEIHPGREFAVSCNSEAAKSFIAAHTIPL